MKRSADDRDLQKLPSATDAKLVFMSKAERRRRKEVVVELPSISSIKTKTSPKPPPPSIVRWPSVSSRRRDHTGRGTGTVTETAIGTMIVASETVSARACAELELERDKELDHIREQYLGSKKPNKRVINKPSEKFRFSFEWDNTEDTFRDINALYQNTHEARLLFGRGFIAGSDRREHKKQAALHEKETREEIRRKEGVEERPEEAAADLYDTFDMRVERHWSEKKIEEMIERDWRVFMILSGAFDVAAEEGVPEEDAGLVDIVEQVAGVGHVSARHQRKKDPCEEAVLAGEAGGEEKGVDL